MGITPWTVPFTAPFTVKWLRFNGSQVDELGNTVPSWADPVERSAVGWTRASKEDEGAGHEAEEGIDIKLMTVPSFVPYIKDRIMLDDSLFEVVGSDTSIGFHRWAPGNVVLLRRVEG